MKNSVRLGLTALLLAAGGPAHAALTQPDVSVGPSEPAVCAEKRVVFNLSRHWLAQLLQTHGSIAPGGQIRIEIRGNSLSVYDLEHVYRYRVVGNDRVEPVGHSLPIPIAMPVFDAPPAQSCG